MAPIQPSIIALAFWTFGSYTARAALAVELFQALMSVLICYVLFRLGKLLFNPWTGLLAALIFAIYPAAIHFALQKFEYTIPLTLLGLLLVWKAIEFSERPGIAGGLALGMISGVAALANPVILAFYPFALLWLVVKFRCEWRTRLKYAAAIVGCCAVVISPWLLRNYLVFDRFVFIKSNFAWELLRANYADGARIDSATDNLASRSANEGQMGALSNRSAMNRVIETPAPLLTRIPGRVFRFWTTLGESTRGVAQLVAGISYYSVLCGALAGVWIARRQQPIQLAVLYLLTIPLPFYVTWSSFSRFRFPIEPILILFASYAVTSLLAGKTIASGSRGTTLPAT
jgi:4-amino-4-deoxy-L-arabinose transferase-like glycosyltransferase